MSAPLPESPETGAMSAFLSAVDELVGAIRGESAWVEELNQLSQAVARRFDDARPGEYDEVLRRYAGLFPDVPLVAVGLVALNCGSLVERGGDPLIAGPALPDKLPRVLETATDFYRRCRVVAEADPDLEAQLAARTENEDVSLDDVINDLGWNELARRFGPRIFREAPEAVLGHTSEHVFGLGVIAHLSASKRLRAVARSRPELIAAAKTADKAARSSPSFLLTMLRVLDDEPLLVLDPETGRGFRVTMSGVADNFQLHGLLMTTLVGDPGDGWLPGPRPEPGFREAVTTGLVGREAPIVTGLFNLWNWTGVLADGTLPDAGTAGHGHWVWNEGVPADIARFDGQRVVVLGPPPYSRSWRAGRVFGGLVPEFRVEAKLSPAEVKAWLGKFAAAPRPS